MTVVLLRKAKGGKTPAAMKLKDPYSLERKSDQPGQRIKEQRHYSANKGSSSQDYGFSSGHVCM